MEGIVKASEGFCRALLLRGRARRIRKFIEVHDGGSLNSRSNTSMCWGCKVHVAESRRSRKQHIVLMLVMRSSFQYIASAIMAWYVTTTVRSFVDGKSYTRMSLIRLYYDGSDLAWAWIGHRIWRESDALFVDYLRSSKNDSKKKEHRGKRSWKNRLCNTIYLGSLDTHSI